MRSFVIVLIAIGLGFFFVAQKRNAQKVAVEQAERAATQPNPSPRPVSEHNWAKHALDKTSKVMHQVDKQRKADDNP